MARKGSDRAANIIRDAYTCGPTQTAAACDGHFKYEATCGARNKTSKEVEEKVFFSENRASANIVDFFVF